MNLLFNLSQKLGVHWQDVRDAMAADSRIGQSHMDPVHKGGRGAGGNCFIKDFAAFSLLYRQTVDDVPGVDVLDGLGNKNKDFLIGSGKYLELLKRAYGDDRI